MYILMKPKGYTGNNKRDVKTFGEMIQLAGQCAEVDTLYHIEWEHGLETDEQGKALCDYLQGACGKELSISPAVWRYRFLWRLEK